MLKFARETFKNNSELSKDASHLLNEVVKGNINPGSGSAPIYKNIHELRSKKGARVYFRNTKDGIEVLDYSKKSNQDNVINYLKSIY